MTRAVEFAYSRTFPAGVKRAFDEVLPYELTRLFDRRYAAIPPIKGVRDQDGAWGTPGQTRTVLLPGAGRCVSGSSRSPRRSASPTTSTRSPAR